MLSTEALYLLYLSTGFTVGFGHCIGMCGPLVVSFSLNLKERSILVPQLLYHLGRITTYAILGGVVAAAGSFTMVAAHLERVQKGVMVFAGILIVLMGFAMAGWLPIARIFGDQTGPGRWISRGFGKLLKIKSTIVYLPLGLLLGLLPCGPVYTALLGTVPALFLVAKLADMGWIKSRNIIYKVGAVLMILVGIFFIIKAIRF
jgi:sulfite exporter TauE/SafE